MEDSPSRGAMQKKEKELMLSKIDCARDHLSAAEVDLQKLLKEMPVAPRAQKVEMSLVIEDAFAKLRLAKSGLAELELLARAPDD
jgi:hypothetical protein